MLVECRCPRVLRLGLCALVLSSWAFFFGNAGCGCAPPPSCPAAPVCAPPPSPACPQAPTGCGGGGSYQQPPPSAQPAFSYVAPSYSQPILPPPPPPPDYQPPQDPPPVPPKSKYVAQQKGSYEQLPPNIYSQIAPTQQPHAKGRIPSLQETPPRVSHSSVKHQQTENNLQREAAAAAGQKNEEVLEEEEGIVEVSENESTDVPPETATTELVEQLVDTANLKLTDDSLCNSEDLRKLMLDNIEENLNNSKRLIQLAAEAQFGGRFDVICANGDFSYVTNTELYCQETKGAISCYTYRQL